MVALSNALDRTSQQMQILMDANGRSGESERVYHFVTDILNNVCNCEQANKLHPIKYACAGRIVLGSLGGDRMKELNFFSCTLYEVASSRVRYAKCV